MRIPRAVLSLAFGIVATVANATPCQEPKLEALAETHPECRFYKGTSYFRAKEYSSALDQWQVLVDLQDIPKEFEYLRVDAQNNLGFLHFMGWGVKQNKEWAIQQYWLPAEKAGHEEAAYHLCHAYAKESPELALGYCREALRRYDKIGRTDGDTNEIIAQIRQLISWLEER